MPRDGSGNYSLPAGNPVVTGTTIDSSWANDTMNDLATEMQDSLSRSGKGGMLSAFRFADGTVGAPGQSWTSETTSGMYRAATNDVRYAIAGVDRIRFRADNTDPVQFWNVTAGAWKNPLNEGGTYTVTGNWTFSGTVDINGPLPLDGATITGLNAEDVDIADAGGIFTGTDVEAALQEVETTARLGSNSNGLGASLIGIEDAAGYFTATDAEAALAESYDKLPQYFYKTADTTRSSTALVTDDPHLVSIAIEADTRYDIEIYAFFQYTNNGDITLRPDITETVQYSRGMWMGTSYIDAYQRFISVSLITGVAFVDFGTASGASSHSAFFKGTFRSNASAGGTLSLKWAQSTSHPDPTTLQAGTFIKLTKMD